MKNSRRDFLKLASLAAAGLSLPVRAQSSLKILVLGGTGFIGPHMVQYALSRGHEVSIFTRGNRQLDIPGVEHLIGDRNDNHDALVGRSWDVILDNNAQDYRWVQTSTELFRLVAEHYIIVSSISAYAAEGFGYDNWQRLVFEPMIDEDYERLSPPEGWNDQDDVPYGLMKALSEDVVRDAFPDRCAVVRPGLIVGPGDPTDRFTYWPVRLDEGGEVLAPGNPNHANQIIDQRDLSEWIVRLAEGRVAGDFNATGPNFRMTMSSMLSAIGTGVDSDYILTWIPEGFLEEQNVNPWSDMPTWIPGDPLSYVSIERAVNAGLTFRSIEQTARDTLEWDKSRPVEERENRSAGLSRHREREIITAWKNRRV